MNGLNSNEVFAQGDLFFYPSKGQSKQQQDKDRYECHRWAVEQTGFDPTAPPPQASAPQTEPQGQVVRGAARGAALGAVGGAIGGDAGKGAAVGAGVGATAGAIRKRGAQQQQQAAQQQQQAASQQKRDQYNKALKACMVGRGYTVE